MAELIRSTSKVILLHEDKILLNACCDRHNGEYYSLPGGGQLLEETIFDAAIRECLEETGYTVKPLRLAAVCEEICDDPEFRRTHPEYTHKMLHIVICALEDVPRRTPTEQDSAQVESRWVHVADLPKLRILPVPLAEHITGILNGTAPVLLGSVRIAHNHG